MDPLYQDCTLLHVDADGFFAAVEQALTPALRGRPVVTGAERGIIAAASYEAKARGIARGLQLHEARRLCPDLAVLPSDYETYSLYSRRLYEILRRFTPCVEEYSIDEAFADLSGCGRVLNLTLEQVAERIRSAASTELGLSVSVGISLTKTLAKLCSKFRKPNGQTLLRRDAIPEMLRITPVEHVWGIGPAGAEKLRRHGAATAADFVRMDEAAVRRILRKPGCETWRELRGQRILPVDPAVKTDYQSMMKGHTFAPPSADPALVHAEALHNLGLALAKLRRHALAARELGLCLRLQDYAHRAATATLPQATSHDAEAAPVLRALFESLYHPGSLYRSTTVWLGALLPEARRQLELFEETPRRRELERLDATLDGLRQRYGQNAVCAATLLERRRKPLHARDAPPARYGTLARGETCRHLALPRLTLPNRV